MASRPGSEAQLLAVYDRIRDSAAAPPLSQRGQGQDVGVLKGWLCPFDIAINRLRDRVRLAPQATHFARMRVGPLGDRRLQDAPGRPSWPRSTTAATWSGRRFAWSTETWRLLRSAPRVARSCGPNRWRRSTTRAASITSAPSRNSKTRWQILLRISTGPRPGIRRTALMPSVTIGEGTHFVFWEKNRRQLFDEVQLFLEEPGSR